MLIAIRILAETFDLLEVCGASVYRNRHWCSPILLVSYITGQCLLRQTRFPSKIFNQISV